MKWYDRLFRWGPAYLLSLPAFGWLMIIICGTLLAETVLGLHGYPVLYSRSSLAGGIVVFLFCLSMIGLFSFFMIARSLHEQGRPRRFLWKKGFVFKVLSIHYEQGNAYMFVRTSPHDLEPVTYVADYQEVAGLVRGGLYEVIEGEHGRLMFQSHPCDPRTKQRW